MITRVSAYDGISETQTKQLLRNEAPGTFVVRSDATSPGTFVFAYTGQHGVVFQKPIVAKEYSIAGQASTFTSLHDLRMQNRGVLIQQLPVQPTGFKDPAVHTAMHMYDGLSFAQTEALLGTQPVGTYLFRPSASGYSFVVAFCTGEGMVQQTIIDVARCVVDEREYPSIKHFLAGELSEKQFHQMSTTLPLPPSDRRVHVYEGMSAAQADALLTPRRVGTYLIRRGEDPDVVVISVKKREGTSGVNDVDPTLVRRGPAGFLIDFNSYLERSLRGGGYAPRTAGLQTHTQTGIVFESLEDLVKKYETVLHYAFGSLADTGTNTYTGSASYHPELSYDSTKAILDSEPPGTYLFRDFEESDTGKVLAFKNPSSEIVQLVVTYAGGMYELNGKRYASLDDIAKDYPRLMVYPLRRSAIGGAGSSDAPAGGRRVRRRRRTTYA